MLQLNKSVCVFVRVCTNRKSQHTHTHTSCCTFMEDIKSVCARQLVRRLLHKLVAVARLGRSPPLLRPSYLYMKSRKKATSLVCVAMFGRHHPPKRAACLSGVKEEGIHKLPDLSSHSSVCRLFIKREGGKGLPCLREYPPPLSWVTFRSHVFSPVLFLAAGLKQGRRPSRIYIQYVLSSEPQRRGRR